MIQPGNTQTRKDEVRFRTSDIRRIVGKFLASNVLKTWNEDFIDESTGEVVTIERNEILFERGSYIDDDLAQQINFSIQAEEIKDVEVSNQRRLAAPLYRVIPVQGKRENWNETPYLHTASARRGKGDRGSDGLHRT